jgi:hypothetical protein
MLRSHQPRKQLLPWCHQKAHMQPLDTTQTAASYTILHMLRSH